VGSLLRNDQYGYVFVSSTDDALLHHSAGGTTDDVQTVSYVEQEPVRGGCSMTEDWGVTLHPEWRHTDHWTMRGNGFLVEVVNYQETSSGIDPHTGQNHWNVYAYIYPGHPLSIQLRGNYLHHLLALPLQRVPSDIRYHHNERGELLSIQIGSDYDHVGDNRFSHAHTLEEAWEVFRDAEELYSILESATDRDPL